MGWRNGAMDIGDSQKARLHVWCFAWSGDNPPGQSSPSWFALHCVINKLFCKWINPINTTWIEQALSFSQMISFLMTKTMSTVPNVSKQTRGADAVGHCKQIPPSRGEGRQLSGLIPDRSHWTGKQDIPKSYLIKTDWFDLPNRREWWRLAANVQDF